MKKLMLVMLLALSPLSLAQADELIGTYVAKLSSQDHFNSKGQRLRNAAAIIRQDRANFHKFHKRDAEDEWDSFFSSVKNRARLERMLNNGYLSKSTKNRIVNGTPTIIVKIYLDNIVVDVY
ncbi:MAG: hypothetical protein CSA44_02630 [Gammaproteobacteria bacterium]|nr:MAG: hypothetical protein CSA44_02630 [Gammaproteobacteria bacterium]